MMPFHAELQDKMRGEFLFNEGIARLRNWQLEDRGEAHKRRLVHKVNDGHAIRLLTPQGAKHTLFRIH